VGMRVQTGGWEGDGDKKVSGDSKLSREVHDRPVRGGCVSSCPPAPADRGVELVGGIKESLTNLRLISNCIARLHVLNQLTAETVELGCIANAKRAAKNYYNEKRKKGHDTKSNLPFEEKTGKRFDEACRGSSRCCSTRKARSGEIRRVQQKGGRLVENKITGNFLCKKKKITTWEEGCDYVVECSNGERQHCGGRD